MEEVKHVESKVELECSSEHASDSSGSLGPPVLTPDEVVRVWRKVDLRLMPIISLLYLFSFLDRGNIGLAKLQGMSEQLELTGNRYNIALSMFFVPYILFEFPSNLVLKRFRPSRWLPGIAIVWGIIMMSMGCVKTYHQLVGVRMCLGFAEAGLFPGVIYYLTVWYPRHKLQYRIGLFFGAAAISGAFSGILAYGISFMKGTGGKLGWSWIFILEGCATIVVGFVALFVMVDFPSTAGFLTPEEKQYVIWARKFDSTAVGEEEHFEARHLIMAITDWQLWLHLLLIFGVTGPLYGISFFLPSIIRGFGYSVAVSNLLTVPPYAVATIVLLIFAHFSDKLKLRWPSVLAGLFLSAIGFAINLADVSIGVKYFGTFLCVTGSYSCVPGVIAWFGGNVAGQYKRAAALALYTGIGNVPGIVASNIYRTQDSPRYKLGHAVELGFVGIGLIVLPIMVLIYNRANAQKQAILEAVEESGGMKFTEEELRRMGDMAPNFRYAI